MSDTRAIASSLLESKNEPKKKPELLSLDEDHGLDSMVRNFLTDDDLRGLLLISNEQNSIVSPIIDDRAAQKAQELLLNELTPEKKLTPKVLFDLVSKDPVLLKQILEIPTLFRKLLNTQEIIGRLKDNLTNGAIDMVPVNLPDLLNKHYNECYLVQLWKKFPFIRTENVLRHFALQQHKNKLTSEHPVQYHPTRYPWFESISTSTPPAMTEVKETPREPSRACWFGL